MKTAAISTPGPGKTETTTPRQHGRTTGSTLLATVVFSGILGVTVLAMLELGRSRLRAEYGRWNWNQAFYHAENALGWAGQMIADSSETGPNPSFLGTYSVSAGSLQLGYLDDLQAEGTRFEDAWVTVQNHPDGVENVFLVTTSAKVAGKVRTLQGTIQKNPPSKVFDYEYFLNNWGWWWGSSITGFGDNRANWDFDFRYNPTVNGSVSSAGQIESNMLRVDPFSGTPPFRGLAGADPISYVHSGVKRLEMPNLKDFTYYESTATAKGGKLFVGTHRVVDAVHSNATKPGLYLEGTSAEPIRVDGPVVIPGDVVIKGKITGIGTLYVGGNLYIADDVTYSDGPDFSSPPSMMNESDRDQWVANAVDGGDDLVAFAVRESILAGDVNSNNWKTYCYNASWGLAHLGSEASLGEDGIRDTPDDGIPYLDTDGNGTPDSAWNDADGDGIVDVDFDYDSDLKMTDTRAGSIDGYPVDVMGQPEDYSSIATISMNRLDGIFYTNHAAAMRLAQSNTIWNGALICRDEAIVYSRTLQFRYDPRIHSKYSADPNRYIDLGLPIALKARVNYFEELPPIEGFYAQN